MRGWTGWRRKMWKRFKDEIPDRELKSIVTWDGFNYVIFDWISSRDEWESGEECYRFESFDYWHALPLPPEEI
jgi:hypothetical protein